MSSLSSAAAPARAAGPPLRLSHLGDELLARYAARGSDRAFTVLYERYHQQLYRYCRSILRDDTDAQDALQSTFAGALVALRSDRRNAPLRPWLYKIAHNEAITLVRRRTRHAGEELNLESLGAGSSAEQEASDRARWRSLVTDLGRLPDRQRGALLLRELSGLSHEEIAIALGTTVAGAKQSIFEARQALAEVAEGRAMSCEEVRRRVSEGDRRVLRGRRISAHLRDCSACGAFALAIPARRTQLQALAPALPPAAAAALLSRSLRAATSHGGGAGGTSAAASAGVAAKVAGTAVTWKALAAGVAVIATTAAGATGLTHLLSHPSSRPGSAQAGHQAATGGEHQLVAGGHHSASARGHHESDAGSAGSTHARGSHQGAKQHSGMAATGRFKSGATTPPYGRASHGKPTTGPGSTRGQGNGGSGGRGQSSGSPRHGSSSNTHSNGGNSFGLSVQGPRTHTHVSSHQTKVTAPRKLLTIGSTTRRSAVGTHQPSR